MADSLSRTTGIGHLAAAKQLTEELNDLADRSRLQPPPLSAISLRSSPLNRRALIWIKEGAETVWKG
jgi:hypothetical protein